MSMYLAMSQVCELGLRANPRILQGEVVNLQYQPEGSVLASPTAAVGAPVSSPVEPSSGFNSTSSGPSSSSFIRNLAVTLVMTYAG